MLGCCRGVLHDMAGRATTRCRCPSPDSCVWAAEATARSKGKCVCSIETILEGLHSRF
jgi:hypothetical protein